MIKIAHFGSYNSNIGDNIALKVVRDKIQKNVKEKIIWIDVKLSSFESYNIFSAVEYFKKINNDCTALLIGGGGLFEGGPYSNKPTGWKLPFNSQILEHIQIPIFIFSAGINYFREVQKFSEQGKESFRALLRRSEMVSLRNDGSLESVKLLFKELLVK